MVAESGLGTKPGGTRWLLLPMDITYRHTMTFESYRDLVDSTFSPSISKPSRPGEGGKSLLVHFTSSLYEFRAEIDFSLGLREMHIGLDGLRNYSLVIE